MSVSLLNYVVGPRIEGKYKDLYNDFMILLDGLGLPVLVARPIVDSVWACYEGPDRHYHNLDHISACLRHFAAVRFDSRYNLRKEDVQAIELGIWFHDVVYDPQQNNNEELSCAFFRGVAEPLKSPLLVEVVADAILHTRHTGSPKINVAQWLVDIDLSILHATSKVFDEYERNVRKEYAFAKDDLWITGRIKVLERFLDRDWIYSTTLYRRLYEGLARENIKRSIARLGRGEVLR